MADKKLMSNGAYSRFIGENALVGGAGSIAAVELDQMFNDSSMTLKEHDWAFGLDGAMDITPSSVLERIGNTLDGLPSEPIAAGTVLNVLQNGVIGDMIDNTPLSQFKGTLNKLIRPHLFDDAMLDSNEIVEIVSDVGNEFSDIEPDAQYVDQASELLIKYGIEDPDGSIATGLAKTSVLAAIGMQMSDNNAINMDPDYDTPALESSPLEGSLSDALRRH